GAIARLSAILGSATLTMVESSTEINNTDIRVRTAQYRRGVGRPSGSSVRPGAAARVALLSRACVRVAAPAPAPAFARAGESAEAGVGSEGPSLMPWVWV